MKPNENGVLMMVCEKGFSQAYILTSLTQLTSSLTSRTRSSVAVNVLRRSRAVTDENAHNNQFIHSSPYCDQQKGA